MAYSDKVVDHFENPRNVGAFDSAGACVGTGVAGMAGGDVIRLQIKVDAATNVIAGARFKAHGNAASIASASLLTEWVLGLALDAAAQFKSSRIAQELALDPIKIHSSILAGDALQAAINDYRAKHGAAIIKA